MKIIIFIILFFFLVNCDATKRRHKKKSYRVVKPVTKQVITPKDILGSLNEAGIGPDDLKRPATNLLLDLYQQLQKRHGIQAENGDDDVKKELFNADTIRTFSTKVAVYEGKGKAKFTFNLTSLSDGEMTQHAELHVRALHQNQNGLHRFRVSILNEDGQKEKRITVKLPAKSHTYDGYLVFDITDIIKKVIEKTNGDFEKVLELSIQHKSRSKKNGNSKQQRVERDVSDDFEPELTNDDGIIVVYSQDNAFFEKFNSHVHHAMNKLNSESTNQNEDIHNRRYKREASKKGEKQKKLCTKKDFIVDFDALGWGRWIVYPKKYNAYMCSGKCPSPVDWSFNPTNHAIIQSLMRLQDKKISRPCCSPTKLEPLSMLYHEYGEIVVRHHEGMVATKCGCR